MFQVIFRNFSDAPRKRRPVLTFRSKGPTLDCEWRVHFMSFKYLKNILPAAVLVSLGALVLSGCASDPNKMGVTNPNQPGPAAGRAVGGAVGGVVGNTAGFVAGVGEGAAAVTGKVFNTRTHVVRQWQYVTTSDGRTIQVPVDIVVDENGVPLKSAPAPKAKEEADHESLSGKAKEK